VAAAPTLQHFGALVAKLGGPREQRRWARLRPLITAIPVDGRPVSAAAARVGTAADAPHPNGGSSEQTAANPDTETGSIQQPSIGSHPAATAAQQAACDPAEMLQSRSTIACAAGGPDVHTAAPLWQEDWAIATLLGRSSTLLQPSTVPCNHSRDVTSDHGNAAGRSDFSTQCSSGAGGRQCSSEATATTVAAKQGGLDHSSMPPPPAPCETASVDVAASRLAPVQHLSADAKTVLAVGDAAKVTHVDVFQI
jgi:hypothetical protein